VPNERAPIRFRQEGGKNSCRRNRFRFHAAIRHLTAARLAFQVEGHGRASSATAPSGRHRGSSRQRRWSRRNFSPTAVTTTAPRLSSNPRQQIEPQGIGRIRLSFSARLRLLPDADVRYRIWRD